MIRAAKSNNQFAKFMMIASKQNTIISYFSRPADEL